MRGLRRVLGVLGVRRVLGVAGCTGYPEALTRSSEVILDPLVGAERARPRQAVRQANINQCDTRISVSLGHMWYRLHPTEPARPQRNGGAR
ncbi:hypothetical protein J2S68_004721 [Glycomyces algeriensis]|nr:hypothetical protein [Glycomyces algeriensis]